MVAVDSIVQAIDYYMSVCVAFLDLLKVFDSLVLLSCLVYKTGLLVIFQIIINVLSMKAVGFSKRRCSLRQCFGFLYESS